MERYLGLYWKEEKKGLFKTKLESGRLGVEADNFAEAQHRLCEKMAEYGVKVALILPIKGELQ
jgi:hypothetical protein